MRVIVGMGGVHRLWTKGMVVVGVEERRCEDRELTLIMNFTSTRHCYDALYSSKWCFRTPWGCPTAVEIHRRRRCLEIGGSIQFYKGSANMVDVGRGVSEATEQLTPCSALCHFFSVNASCIIASCRRTSSGRVNNVRFPTPKTRQDLVSLSRKTNCTARPPTATTVKSSKWSFSLIDKEEVITVCASTVQRSPTYWMTFCSTVGKREYSPHPWLENMYESIIPRLRRFERSEATAADMG